MKAGPVAPSTPHWGKSQSFQQGLQTGSPASVFYAHLTVPLRGQTHFAGWCLEKVCKASFLSSYKTPHCGRQVDSRPNIHLCVGTSEEILNCGESGVGQKSTSFYLIVVERSPLQKVKEM